MARQMKRGRHAADDGSFGKSAGMAAGRGTALLAVAVVLGIVLLNATDESPSSVSTEPDTEQTQPTTPSGGDPDPTTSTTAPAPPARLPAQVKVIAVNGAGVNGAGAKITDVLREAGFNVLAPLTGTRGSTTAVFHAAGFEREGAAVATSLAVPTSVVQALGTPPPVADIRGADVVVIVGADLANRITATPSSSSTSSTAPRSTTASSTTSSTRP